jgi:hypothetical protein
MPKNTSLNVRLTKEQKEKIIDRMKYERQTNLSQFTIDKLLYTPNNQMRAIYQTRDIIARLYEKLLGNENPKYSPSRT